ncbi:MAG: response regulator [Lachnospiraceae bacterium]|nr:response regulator [Lachnospiraceae bacterium]
MYELVISIQVASIVLVFIECMIVFNNLKSKTHAYLFLSCIATLVNNVGYLMRLTADSAETYYEASKFFFMGGVWQAFAFVMFIAEICRIRVRMPIRLALSLFCAVTYVIFLTTDKTGLYYSDWSFRMEDKFPVFEYEHGIWHIIYAVVLILYILAAAMMLMTTYIKEQNPIRKKRLLLVFFSVVTQAIFLILRMVNIFSLDAYYDVTELAFPIATVIMIVAILKYNLFDTEKLARDYVVDELSEGIIATNEKGDVDFCNKAAYKIFPELETDSDSVLEQIRNAIKLGDPISIEDRIYTPLENNLIQDGVQSGKIYAVLDSTVHYRDMANLEEQKQIANEANKAKSAFLANMSHEIRTPINAVLGMDEMILRDTNEEQTYEYAMNISAAGNSLLGIINDVLDFSKIEAGKMEIIPVEYDFASTVHDLVTIITPRINEKGLRFKTEIDENTPHILFGDEIRIKQIITNLLTNAAKYTESGSVTLNITYSEIDDEHVKIYVSVKDTGIGIKDGDISKLTNAFERIEEKRNRNIEGTGIGINITYRLLEMMGSKLQVSSVYGEGSEFSFVIEQKVISWESIGNVDKKWKESLRKKRSSLASFKARNAKILAVDDTTMNLRVFTGLLKPTEINIDIAESGRECIKLMEDNRYDMVFLDHRMPDMDGVETLQKIKEMNLDENNLPIIALTANVVSGARDEYLGYGFTDYLTKPVNYESLQKMILKYLPEELLDEYGNEKASNDSSSKKKYSKSENEYNYRPYSKEEYDQDTLIALIEIMESSLDNGNYKRAEEMIDMIKKYNYPEDIEEELKLLFDAIDNDNDNLTFETITNIKRMLNN